MRQLVISEPNQTEIEVLLLQSREFDSKKPVVPTCVFGQLIVRNQVSTLLRFAEMIQHDHRHFFEPQLSRCKESAVASNDARVRIHENGVVEAKCLDAGRDLRDLRVRVSPGISGKGTSLSITHRSICFAIECRFIETRS